jgi:hypothetical protein
MASGKEEIGGLFSFEVVKEFFINIDEKEKVNFPFCWEISFYSLYLVGGTHCYILILEYIFRAS